MQFEIILHGVRGSLPTSYHPDILEERILRLFLEYEHSEFTNPQTFLASIPHHLKGGFGGNTTCVEVKTTNSRLIIDAGTGIRHIIPQCMKEGCQKGNGVVHLFFTHFHWDHILGLPFFTPIYIPGNTIHLYSVQPDLENILRAVFQKPFFPVPYQALGAKLVYHQLDPRIPYKIDDMTITPYQLDHPDPCWGIKVSHHGKAYAHCVDTEALRTSQMDLGEDLPLYQDIDLMVFDAQYSFQEAKEKLNWGHSSAPRGLEVALREKVKKIVFVHHDPMATDEQVARITEESVKYFQSTHHQDQGPKTLEWTIGYEGMKLKLI